MSINTKNLAESTVSAAPAPALSGATLQLASTAEMPSAPFEVTLHPAGVAATRANAEIVLVKKVVGKEITVVRGWGGTVAKSIENGWVADHSLTMGMINAMSLTFNPVSFGAAWDGVTDDTVPIQEAHDAAEAVEGVLWTPQGTGMTKGLLLGSGVKVRGPGKLKLVAHTKLKVGEQGDVICTKGFKALAIAAIGGEGPGTSEAGVHNFSIEITVDGNRANQSAGEGGCGMRIYGYGYVIDKAVARNCVEWPIASEGTYAGFSGEASDSMEARLTDIKAHGCGKGIYFNGPHDSVLTRVWPYGNDTGAVGFDLGTKANGVELVNCHPWAYNEKPLAAGAILRGSGQKVLGGQYEGHYAGGVGIKVLVNEYLISGALVYTTGAGKETGRGIQFGSTTENVKGEAGTVTVSGGYCQAVIFGCSEGPLDFQKIANSHVEAIVYLPGGKAYIGTPTATCTYDIYNIGEGAGATGNIFKPVPFYGAGSGVGAQIQVSRKAGSSADGDFAVEPADGTLQLNTTTNALEYRSGGAWRPVGQPNSGIVKTKRQTTGSVASKATATISIVWGAEFADGNYTINANVAEGTGNIVIKQIVSWNAKEVKIEVENTHATEARTGTLHVHAIHD